MQMNKIVIGFVTVFFASVLVGCGNSPDGDGQKPTDGAYGVMSDSYGPAGDGNSRRMANADPNIDRSTRKMRNTKQKKPGSAAKPKPMDPAEVIEASQPRMKNADPTVDPGKRTMENK